MKCKECGNDITELIYDAIKDSNEDNFDGYYDCSTVFIICPSCGELHEIGL